MMKKLTITVDEHVCEGLHELKGSRSWKKSRTRRVLGRRLDASVSRPAAHAVTTFSGGVGLAASCVMWPACFSGECGWNRLYRGKIDQSRSRSPLAGRTSPRLYSCSSALVEDLHALDLR